jgi:lysyl-tRNA synthetase class 2
MSHPSWQPSASIATLRQRASFMAKIRQFFNERHYLEVETPTLSSYGITDVYLSQIKASFRGQSYFLQTSPEYHMKRLLAAQSGPIFQLARVFRDDELGRWHNPEFTLLEWYQLGIDHHELMNEVDCLLQTLAQTKPLKRKTYQEAFQEACAIDPLTACVQELKQTLISYQLETVLDPDEQDKDLYLFLLMSHVVEPYLAQEEAPIAIYDYPPSQAVLAQINQGVAERFEIYYRGIELANGFHELQDVTVQKKRLEQDNIKRVEQNKPEAEIDPYFIAALEQGLPACSGVALGVDRLLALCLNEYCLSGVLAFDFLRA